MPAHPYPEIRDTLFGDQSFAAWASHTSAGEPWQSFTAAKTAFDKGDKETCISILSDIVNRKDLEPRHYLQGWHFLRQLSGMPAREKEKQLYGMVIEVGLQNGLDLVAAYSDFSARYYNYSGAAVIWERPDTSLNKLIQNLLHTGSVVVARIGPWNQPRPPAPPEGQARINMLTPSGLHFGQAALRALSNDPLGGPVLAGAFTLMQELIKKTNK
jgi:hypothetical protein